MIDLLQIAETQLAINDMVSPLWPIHLLLCFFFLRLNKSNKCLRKTLQISSELTRSTAQIKRLI